MQNVQKKFARIIALNKPFQRNDFSQVYETKNYHNCNKNYLMVPGKSSSTNKAPMIFQNSVTVSSNTNCTSPNSNKFSKMDDAYTQTTSDNHKEDLNANIQINIVFKSLIEKLFKFLKEKTSNEIYVIF